jgi:hypothetical protein
MVFSVWFSGKVHYSEITDTLPLCKHGSHGLFIIRKDVTLVPMYRLLLGPFRYFLVIREKNRTNFVAISCEQLQSTATKVRQTELYEKY